MVSACAGGGGGGNNLEPCCAASGSVEEPGGPGPALTFAGGATGAFAGLRVRPVVLSTGAACPTISNPDLPGLLDLEAAAVAPANIDVAAGTYELTLTDNAIGRRVAFVVECVDSAVCAGGLTEGVVGVGLLGGIVQAGAPTLTVAPIRLVSTTGGVGVSTLELLADCELDTRGVRGNLTTADVRHLITPAIAASLVPSAANANALIAHLTLFDSAMASPRGYFGTNGSAQLFVDERAAAEALVDRCLAGESVLGCTSATVAGSEHARYFAFARTLQPADAGLSPYVLQTWAQQISDKLGPDALPDTDVLGASMLRQDEMFRFQLAHKEIEEALVAPITSPSDGAARTVSLTFSTGGLPSISEAVVVLRTALQDTPPTDPIAFGQRWMDACRSVMGSIDAQVYNVNGGTTSPMTAAYNQAGIGGATQMRAALGPASTADEAFAAVYGTGDGTTGLYERLLGEVNLSLAPADASEALRLADVLFFCSANSVAPMGPIGFAPAKPAPLSSSKKAR